VSHYEDTVFCTDCKFFRPLPKAGIVRCEHPYARFRTGLPMSPHEARYTENACGQFGMWWKPKPPPVSLWRRLVAWGAADHSSGGAS
jgi:hypothetical protein